MWSPSYVAAAIEQHLGLLLYLAVSTTRERSGTSSCTFGGGEMWSPNRQGPQANAEDIRRIAKELSVGERDEVLRQIAPPPPAARVVAGGKGQS